jgi:hypothetical protein
VTRAPLACLAIACAVVGCGVGCGGDDDETLTQNDATPAEDTARVDTAVESALFDVGPSPTPFLSGLAGPAPLARDGDGLWFATEKIGAIWKVPITGGTPAKVVDAPCRGIFSIALDAENVFFSCSSGLMRAPRSGGAPVMMAPLFGTRIAVVGRLVYATNFPGGSVVSIPVDATFTPLEAGAPFEPTMVARGIPGPTTILAHEGDLYVVGHGTSGDDAFGPIKADGNIVRVTIASGAIDVLAKDLRAPQGIAVVGDDLFFTTVDAVMRMPKNGGAAPLPIVEGEAVPCAVASDGRDVFWLTKGSTRDAIGALSKLPAGATTPVRLAENLLIPFAIVVDTENVYWTTRGFPYQHNGTVGKLPK